MKNQNFNHGRSANHGHGGQSHHGHGGQPHWGGPILGSRWDDELTGTDWNDVILGKSGDDTLFGGAGNDMLNGGRGFDTAVYEGSVLDYAIFSLAPRAWWLPSPNAIIVAALGDTGEGIDWLTGVEALYFEGDDYTLYLDGTNNAVLAGDDSAAATENLPLTIDVATLLANDHEFDGDTMTIVDVDATSALGAEIAFDGTSVTYIAGANFDALAEGEEVNDTFTYTVTDGRGGTDTATVTVTVTGTNDAPTLSLVSAVTVDENTTDVPVTLLVNDPDSFDFSFSLSGTDAGLFTIDETTGAIAFAAGPDYEAPADADGDNAYELTVTVTDDFGASASQDLTVNVADVLELPEVEARINELHYDNAGTDTGEFVEVRVAAGDDVSYLTLELVNGNGGAVYASYAVAAGTMTTDGTWDYYAIATPGIQNGAPDGVVLTNGPEVIEFVSYEGELTATDGAAAGLTSTDIGVTEGSSTPVGFSLQREADGSWSDAREATAGADNTPAQTPVEARINEFHYDNAGTDTGEFIEVRVNAGADVSGLGLELMNGSNGSVYNTLAVADGTMSSDGTWDYYVLNLPANGLQNGAPDGIVLTNGGSVVEFISYEGQMTAAAGTAAGMTSTDIGVSEASDTEVGLSLQRAEDGSWFGPEASTAGAANAGSFSARINEFHYDNYGSDVGEFVEVRVNAGGDASGLLVELMNGNNGAVYTTLDIASATMTSDGVWDYYVFDLPANGIQNGAPDGIVLSNAGEVIEFLSYEGTMTAVDGAAAGLTSTDIGVAEDSTTEVGESLQRADDGSWYAPGAETKGAANAGDNGGTDPEPTVTLISAVQGTGSESAYVGQTVTLSAIVTHVTASGFYLQEEATDSDGNILTSEGIFVYSGGAAVSLGDLVEVTGAVTEYYGMTQITSVSSTVVQASDMELPPATLILLSPDTAQNYEAYEGMRVSLVTGTSDALTVIENFNLDRYGEIVVSSGIQTQPTQIYDAQTQSAEIAALLEANANASIIIDDGSSTQNPDEFQFLPGGAGDNGNGYLDSGDDFSDTGSTIRLGAEITGSVEGVLNFGYDEWRITATETLTIDESTNSGARTDAPEDVGGTLQVASYNVLNFFTTLDDGSLTGPNGDLDPRGASNATEFERQATKIVDGIIGTGAEVLALQEIENNGFGSGSAISTLVDLLNAEGPGASYAFVDPTGAGDYVGDDAIMPGIIYDAGAATLVHAEVLTYEEASDAATYAIASALASLVGASFSDYQRNRPTVAATFVDLESGEEFTVVASHFKSKGDSGLQDLADAAESWISANAGSADLATVTDLLAQLYADSNFDQGNGQGFWNGVRTDAASELAEWITTEYNGGGTTNVLMLGDMNSYAEEDPVQYLDDVAGFTDLIDTFIGQDQAYSYVYDGMQGTLDQGFGDAELAASVTGVTEWHINADEPDLIGYDTDYTNPAFYNDGVYGSSDHDPLIVGLDFGSDALLV